MSNPGEISLTFQVPDTDFSMLTVELALRGLRTSLPTQRPDYPTEQLAGIMYAYEILQRVWQRYCETVPEALEWAENYPPLQEIWHSTRF